jgi:hypothetical protein
MKKTLSFLSIVLLAACCGAAGQDKPPQLSAEVRADFWKAKADLEEALKAYQDANAAWLAVQKQIMDQCGDYAATMDPRSKQPVCGAKKPGPLDKFLPSDPAKPAAKTSAKPPAEKTPAKK